MRNEKMQVHEAIKMVPDEEVEWDEFVCILGDDIGKYNGPYKVTKGLYRKCGENKY
jgi:pyruvate dehydrogenase E1 component beta subunit